MEHLVDPEKFVGLRGQVVPGDDDPFTQEFSGRCIGVRHGFLQVRDAGDDVYEVEVSQFTPDIDIGVRSVKDVSGSVPGTYVCERVVRGQVIRFLSVEGHVSQGFSSFEPTGHWRAALHIGDRMQWQWFPTKPEAINWVRTQIPYDLTPDTSLAEKQLKEEIQDELITVLDGLPDEAISAACDAVVKVIKRKTLGYD
jgi:hypothetical protein